MTCPSLIRRAGLTAAAHEGRSDVARLLEQGRHTLVGLPARLQADDARAQFARFVVVGGLSSAVYALVFIALGGLGDQTANLVGAVGSTLLANEMHRRLTFHAGQQVTWLTAQWEGGGLAAIGLVATSLTLAGVHALIGDVGTVAQLCLIAAVTGAIGLVRFIALRSWVFTGSTSRP
ncbi:GtrA family protein [Modestobacter sp. SSW1-42]|uniref:GtrA family protein n=1 Tax=Modestobacter sp. SSW1-42 TaxID=596372 RepID=UPI003986C465